MVNRVGRFLVVVLFGLLAPQTGSAAPIEEGYFAPINGMEQWITVRGRDSRNPILLFLHGAGHATVFFADELLRLLNTHVRPRVTGIK